MMLTTLLSTWQVLMVSFWLGRLVGTEGLSTIAVMEPVFTILALVSGAPQVGVQVLTAEAAGRGEGSVPVIVNGIYWGLAWALCVTTVGFVFLDPIVHRLAGDIGIATGLRHFLIPWLICYAAPVVTGVTLFAVSATGWTRFGVIQSILSLVFALTLMPVFIRLLGFGIAGATLTDACSDTLLLALTCFALYKYRDDLGLGTWRRKDWRVDVKILKHITSRGLFYQAARAMDFVAYAVMVRIMMESGRQSDVAAYGIAFLLIATVAGWLTCIGVAGSIMISQNVGAKQPDRAKAILRSAIGWLSVSSVALFVVASFPEPLTRIFTDDPAVISRTTDVLAVLRWSAPAGLLGSTLLRCYTAVSPNKLGSSLSIVSGVLAIVVANVVEGAPLVRIGAGLISSQSLRLILLVLSYRRSFSSIVAKV